MKMTPITAIVGVAVCMLLTAPVSVLAAGDDMSASFKGKTIVVVVPNTAGGSTDISARLVTKFFSKYLPGAPVGVVSNVPGGNGVAAMNYMVQQAKPDGSTLIMATNALADRIIHRAPQAHYDPTKFQIVGGVGIGDNVLVVRTDALSRLQDKQARPVIMGSATGVPRSAMRMTIWGAEFLGWNTKWVLGYRGTPDLVLALERGEIDMTVLTTVELDKALTDSGKFAVLYKAGLARDARPTGRTDVDNAPLFINAMEGKIKDPKIEAAYDYWRAGSTFKWLALPPGTSDAIRDAYREAFLKTTTDPEFIAQADVAMNGFVIISPPDTIRLVHTLASTSDDTLDAMDMLMRKQGLDIAVTNEKK